MINEPITTGFYLDFLEYYKKAKILQDKHELKFINTKKESVHDDLMNNVHIYDCVERRQAGFSNALQDIHGKRSPASMARIPTSKNTNKIVMRFLHLIHRFTGSGASFEEDHGYRNSILNKLVMHINSMRDMYPDRANQLIIKDCINSILLHKGPTVTSKGNQPPSLKNPEPTKYKLAQHYYFDNFAYDFIVDYSIFLEMESKKIAGPIGIKQAVDYCLAWHKARGFKQWKFIMTAFVMDDAEYSLEIDPESHCYYGPNCIKAFKLMFTKAKGAKIKNADFFEKCMQRLVDATSGNPYDLEDVCCDMIRYWTEYVPKNGYEHLSLIARENASCLKNYGAYPNRGEGEYPQDIKDRLTEVVGYWKYGQK